MPRHPEPSAVVPLEEMPWDNAELAKLVVEFPRLAEDSPRSCPVPTEDILRYLGDEAPGGARLHAEDLTFVRTAQVGDRRYWIWRFSEPDDGSPAYATVSVDASGVQTVGYDSDWYRLTPEQYMLGDYHNVF